MAIAKIILNADTQIDLTQDTTDAQYTLQGYTGHRKDGTTFTGTYTPSAPTGTKQIVIDSAGVTTEDVSAYASTEITVPQGEAYIPAFESITATPSISVSNGGLITASVNASKSITPGVDEGWISSGTAGRVSASGSSTEQLSTQGAVTITPSTSQQTAVTSGKYTTGNVVVDPIPSQYIVPTGTISITQNATGVDVSQYASADINVAGSTDVKTGTLTVASNVNTSTSTQITTTNAIGFTPTKFLFYKTERTATSNHVHQASFITIGSYYIRTMTRYSSNALSTSGNTNNWTTQTAGYLYYSSNTIYFRSSSSYILSAGTWHWVAIQ